MSQDLSSFFTDTVKKVKPSFSIMPDLTSALDKLYNKPRNGVHVSDLVNCTKKASKRRLNPVKTTMTELNFFTLGKSLHQAAQDLVNIYPDIYRQEQEVWLRVEDGTSLFVDGAGGYTHETIRKHVNPNTDIVAHIDIYNVKENIPVEMKGIRKSEIDEPKSFHVTQLKYYMAMTNADRGIILYQLLMNYKDQPFKEFLITMTDSERLAIKAELIRNAKMFSDSILTGNPNLAPSVWNNKELNYQCRTCNYFNECREWESANGS